MTIWRWEEFSRCDKFATTPVIQLHAIPLTWSAKPPRFSITVHFHKTWQQWSHRPPDPTCKIWLQSVHWGRGCACAKFAVRHLFLRAKALLSERLSNRNSVCLSVCPSVCPSVTRVDQSKTVQDRITKSSLSAAGKTLVSGTVKRFHKFEGDHSERGR